MAFISGRNVIVGTFDGGGFSLDKRSDLISYDEISNPSWSPNGEKIAFYYGGPRSLYNVMFMSSKDAHIEGQNSKLWVYPESPISWSPDGKNVVIVGDYQTENWNLYITSTSGHTIQLTNSDRRDHCPVWSPQ